MGVVLLGRYTRIRWRRASQAILAQLEVDATSLTAAALLHGAEEAWGLAPSQPSMLAGYDIERSDGWDWDRIVILPERPGITSTIALPREGRWIVGVEHSGSMWAALRGVKVVDRSEICLDWNAVDLPGAGPLTLGIPRRWHEPFILIAPPPRAGMFPAQLDRDGVLLTAPFRSEKGLEDEAPPLEQERLNHYLDGICHRVTTLNRYGLLADGVMTWLELKPGVRPTTATPTTALFRARLVLLKSELAARGIYYDDDADETGYELRYAIEDGAVPASFHEPYAAIAYTVSGENAPSDDKWEQARALYDPENDWETGQSYAIDYPTMQARVDVKATRLVFYTSELTKVDGVAVNDAWAKEHLEIAGLAAGLDAGASDYPALAAADLQRLEGATGPHPIGWNAVDAADRVQRAAYALATSGVPDSAIEASLSRLRGPIVRALLGRDVLRAADVDDQVMANGIAATLPPLAPGPFPRRAYAVINLADALADEIRRPELLADALGAADDPLERRLALLFAVRAGGRPEMIARGAASWVGHAGAEALVADARRWGANVAETLLGTLDAPDAADGEVKEDDQHTAPRAL